MNGSGRPTGLDFLVLLCGIKLWGQTVWRRLPCTGPPIISTIPKQRLNLPATNIYLSLLSHFFTYLRDKFPIEFPDIPHVMLSLLL